MKKQYLLFGLLATFLLLLFNSACNATATADIGDAESVAGEAHLHEDSEHVHMHAAPPKEFAGLANPFAEDEAAIAAGKETYDTLCATCHGPEGKGDGLAAEGLDPQPASLADGTMMRQLSEGYLFWRVSKGGAMEPFNSAMPAWEDGLSEAQRWELVSYIRTLANDDFNHMDDDRHEANDHMEEGGHMNDEHHPEDN